MRVLCCWIIPVSFETGLVTLSTAARTILTEKLPFLVLVLLLGMRLIHFFDTFNPKGQVLQRELHQLGRLGFKNPCDR